MHRRLLGKERRKARTGEKQVPRLVRNDNFFQKLSKNGNGNGNGKGKGKGKGNRNSSGEDEGEIRSERSCCLFVDQVDRGFGGRAGHGHRSGVEGRGGEYDVRVIGEAEAFLGDAEHVFV